MSLSLSLNAAEHMKTLPLFVDDIQMGRDAGVTTVAVLSGIGSREDLKDADHIIQRYEF